MSETPSTHSTTVLLVRRAGRVCLVSDGQVTMNNQIVYNLYYAFAERGFSVLRVNFRGVGRAQGGGRRLNRRSGGGNSRWNVITLSWP